MAATISWDGLRELAGFRATEGLAVSFYMDLDPGTTPTAGDAATRVSSLLTEAARHLDRPDLTHEQRKSLRADLDRIRSYFANGFEREGARGVAVFVSRLDNLWRALPLAESVEDTVKVDHELLLTPLVPVVGRGEGAIVAAVGRERGELFRLRGGRLEPISDLFAEQHRRHDQGGWSQARYARHIEHQVYEHLQEVAAALDRRVRRCAERIVVVTTEETRAVFEDLLTKEVLDSVVGWAHAEAHAGPAELLAVAAPVLEAWRAAEEERALERWREEAGRKGRATAGWGPTLEAASDGRVAMLLYRNGVGHAAWRCPKCNRLAAEDGACPLDGTTMEPTDDGLALAVHHTLSQGGAVWAVTAGQDLDPVEGIGALLRY